jgi:hypothetical protein
MAEVNLQVPRSMAQPIDKNMSVTTFLRDNLCPGVKTYVTEEIDVDTRKGKQLVAPFVAKNVSGINVARTGYTTKTYIPPRVAPERPLDPKMLMTRQMGETIHTLLSPEQRQDAIIQKDAQEMDNMITRREELMVGQLATTGVIQVRGYLDERLTDFIDDNMDYQIPNIVTLTGADQWTLGTSTKYKDLKDATILVRKAGYNPKICIMDPTAWDNAENDSNFIDKFNKLHFNIGEIAMMLQTQNGNGYLKVGTITELGMDFYVYFAWYLDPATGLLAPYIPENYVIIAPGSIAEMNYGAVTQLEKDERFHTYEGARVPKMMVDVNGDSMKYRLTSRPMPVPFDTAAWVSINTVGGAG